MSMSITKRIKYMQAKKEKKVKIASLNQSKGRFLLNEWMKKKGVSISKLSYDLKVLYPQTCRWVNGSATPSLRYAAAIEEYTNFDITCRMWITPYEPLKLAKKPNTSNANQSKSQKSKKHTNGRP
jgi:plasmid maintenance system antidote protein VapI